MHVSPAMRLEAWLLVLVPAAFADTSTRSQFLSAVRVSNSSLRQARAVHSECIERMSSVAPPQADPLDESNWTQHARHFARHCETTNERHAYWIVNLRIAAYVARSFLEPDREWVFNLLLERKRVGCFGVCLPLECLELGKTERQDWEPSDSLLALLTWFTFQVILLHGVDRFPRLEARDIASMIRYGAPVSTTAECESVTKARFPFPKFLQREGVEVGTTLRIASVGAIGDCLEDNELRVLLHHGAQVFGFDKQEFCEKTNADFASATVMQCGGHFQCIGALIGDGKNHPFFYNRKYPVISSLYRARRSFWNRFVGDISGFRKVNVSTKRLDDLNLGQIDFLKLDIQGGEILALSGAEKILESVLVVQVEVSMEEMYHGQPLFSEVDTFLRSRGFTFHRLIHSLGLTVRPLHQELARKLSTHQMWGDAVYLRGMFAGPGFPGPALSAIDAIKSAWLLHELYQSYDVALHFLKQYGRQLATAYLLELADGARLLDPVALILAMTEMHRH